jgi:hypothetical protein
VNKAAFVDSMIKKNENYYHLAGYRSPFPIILLFLSIFLLRCTISAATSGPMTSSIQYKHFRGSIKSTLLVTMDLVIDNSKNEIAGSYFYNRFGRPVGLRGKMNGTKISLEEDDGVFAGSFESDSLIKGTWTNNAGTKIFPFAITENYSDGAQRLDFYSYSNGKNANGNSFNVNYTFFQIRSRDNAIAATSINKMIGSHFFESDYNPSAITTLFRQKYTQFLTDNEPENNGSDKSQSSPYPYSERMELSVLFNFQGILCIRTETALYAGMPVNTRTYDIYDCVNGVKVALGDLLEKGYEAKLSKIIMPDYMEQKGIAPADYGNTSVGIADQYYIDAEGIHLSYSEGASHAPVEEIIEYKAITELIRKDGPIPRILKGKSP